MGCKTYMRKYGRLSSDMNPISEYHGPPSGHGTERFRKLKIFPYKKTGHPLIPERITGLSLHCLLMLNYLPARYVLISATSSSTFPMP